MTRTEALDRIFFEFTFSGDNAKVSVLLGEIATFGEYKSGNVDPQTGFLKVAGTLIRLKSGRELIIKEEYENIKAGLLLAMGLG